MWNLLLSLVLSTKYAQAHNYIYPHYYHQHRSLLDHGYSLRSLQDSGEHKTCARYNNEPIRSSELNWNNQCPNRDEAGVVCQDKRCPYNAEVSLHELASRFVTPNHLFFVRSHWPTPDLHLGTYELKVINGREERRYSMWELVKRFRQRTIMTAIQCGGNRRKEMHAVRNLTRLLWAGGAIGNALWTGVLLSDVLADVGITWNTMGKFKHVGFEAFDVEVYAKNDTDPFKKTGEGYKVSIPLERVLDPSASMDPVILAFKMNGEYLPRDHGFPLRVVAPGIVGARNIKWLKSIELRETEAESFHQRKDYKVLPSWITSRDQVDDWEKYPSVQQMPIQSKICDFQYSRRHKTLSVKGYAWTGNGTVRRVDVSINRGHTWKPAVLLRGKPPLTSYSWVLWEAEFPANEDDSVEAWSKATDNFGNSQPDTIEEIWNMMGINSNAVSRMNFTVAVRAIFLGGKQCPSQYFHHYPSQYCGKLNS